MIKMIQPLQQQNDTSTRKVNITTERFMNHKSTLTKWFEQHVLHPYNFINGDKSTATTSNNKSFELVSVPASQNEDLTEDCTDVEDDEELSSLLLLPTNMVTATNTIRMWDAIQTTCHMIVADYYKVTVTTTSRMMRQQQHEQNSNYEYYNAYRNDNYYIHNNMDHSSSFPFLLKNEEDANVYDSYSDDDDDDMIRVLYHGRNNNTGIDTTDNVATTTTMINDIPHDNINYDHSNKSTTTQKKWLNETIIDQRFYYSLYKQHHIHDVRIYSSIIVLLINYDKNYHRNSCGVHIADEDDSAITNVGDAVRIIATYLIDPSISTSSKYAVLSILFHSQILNIDYNDTKDDEIILRNMYAFCIALYFGVHEFDIDTNASSTIMNNSYSKCTSQVVITSCPMIWELRSACLYLQELYTVYDDLSILTQNHTLSTSSSVSDLSEAQRKWEYVKWYCYDHDSLLLQDLDLLYKLFASILNFQTKFTILIASIGYIRICLYHSGSSGSSSSYSSSSITSQNYWKYSEALRNVARVLSDWSIPKCWKLAILYCLHYNKANTDIRLQRTRWNKITTVSFVSQLQNTQRKNNNISRTTDNDLYYSKILAFCTFEDAYSDSFLILPQDPHNNDDNDRIKNDRSNNPEEETYKICSSCDILLLLWELRVLCTYYQKERKEQRQQQFALVRQTLLQVRSMLVRVVQQSSHRIRSTTIITDVKHKTLPSIITKINQAKKILSPKM